MFDMTLAEMVGSVGVFLLLTAFFLNLTGMITVASLPYVCLNMFGAMLACYASYLVDFLPFVILEGIWAIVATVALGQFLLQSRPAGSR